MSRTKNEQAVATLKVWPSVKKQIDDESDRRVLGRCDLIAAMLLLWNGVSEQTRLDAVAALGKQRVSRRQSKSKTNIAA